MNLERTPVGESAHGPRELNPPPFQLPLFPKRVIRDNYTISCELIDRIVAKVSGRGLCGSFHVKAYLQRQLRHNCRPNTIRGSGTAIMLFLEFFKNSGYDNLADVGREHVSAFVEHEQDRGLASVSVDGRLKTIYAFLGFLVDRNIISADILKRKLRIKVPDALPRAIDPEDIRHLLTTLEKPRDRALILTLLRTGMRIGELLNTKLEDLNLKQQQIQIKEAQKNRVGRIVYLSGDAVEALVQWLQVRKYPSAYLFYGQEAGPLCYEAARAVFIRCLEKTGLAHKGYTLHCLRHTYASELLNAGMPLQCLQELLGHRCIEMTRRYARLTDKTRKEAYYQAMNVIEAGEIHGHYQFDYPLPQIAQTT